MPLLKRSVANAAAAITADGQGAIVIRAKTAWRGEPDQEIQEWLRGASM